MTEPERFRPDAATVLRGRLSADEPMAGHVSWRAGGRARRAYTPADSADLQAFLGTVDPREPVTFVGLGSNLLVRDGGYAGTVVLMHHTHARISLVAGEDGTLVHAEAGAASPKLARFTATHGLEGAEFLAGVPGTVGGALAMNAGCYGSETWDIVASVSTIARAGTLRERTPAEFETGYRHVELRGARLGEDEWFVGARFRLRRGSIEASRKRITEWLTRRVATQPLNWPNAGSVFRNPPGDYAARLIEACGLKGFAIGGARISEKHANFIVNDLKRGRGATAADIEALIHHAREVVRARFGIELVPEVRIIGEGSNGS